MRRVIKRNCPEDFPIQTPAGLVEYGDLILYGNNDTTVPIYATAVFNGWIVDGNVMCSPESVVRILVKKAMQSL